MNFLVKDNNNKKKTKQPKQPTKKRKSQEKENRKKRKVALQLAWIIENNVWCKWAEHAVFHKVLNSHFDPFFSPISVIPRALSPTHQ